MRQESQQTVESSRVIQSAGLIGLAVMGSRLLGLVREQVVAYFFATGVSADALYAAFRIPNLLRDLFGEGVLSKAFVTTFTATELEDGDEAAGRLASRIFNLVALVLSVLIFAGILGAPVIVDLMFSGRGFDAELDPSQAFGFTTKRALTVYLTRIMFPFLMLVSFAAVAMGLLNSKGKFGISACASSFFNLGFLAVGVWGYYFAQRIGVHPATGMAIGVVVGGALQFFVQVPSMWRVGFRYRLLISFRDARVQQLMRLIGPAVLGVAALQINLLVNSIFASHGSGWLAYLSRAFRLMHLPIGVFGVAISTAALPNLAKLFVRGDFAGYRRSFSHALALNIVLALPASIGLFVLAEPICRLIFEWGKSTPFDTVQTARALIFFSFGLCGFSAVKIVTDGFYALNNTGTPVKVSFCTVAFNIVLNYVFIFRLRFDHTSLALSTSLTTTLNFLFLLVLLSRKIKGLGLAQGWNGLLRITAASVIMGIGCWRANVWIEGWVGVDGVVARSLGVFVPIVIGVTILLALCKFLKVQELNSLMRVILRR